MKDFGTKVNDSPTATGVVDDDDYNSTFSELKNMVTPFLTLDAGDDLQAIKSMDILSKAQMYVDGGSANIIELTRAGTSDAIESLVDGMVVLFSPKFDNTGATTIKVNALDAKDLRKSVLGTVLSAGDLSAGTLYIAVYSSSSGYFRVYEMSDDRLKKNRVYKGSSDEVVDSLGSQLAPTLDDFDSDLVASGYQDISGGLIVQWGKVEVNIATGTYSYPKAFSNGVFSIVGSSEETGGSGDIKINSISNTQFQANAAVDSTTVNYIALGY